MYGAGPFGSTPFGAGFFLIPPEGEEEVPPPETIEYSDALVAQGVSMITELIA